MTNDQSLNSLVQELNGGRIVPLEELEKAAIVHALEITHGNVTKAARELGMGRATLYRRLAALKIPNRQFS